MFAHVSVYGSIRVRDRVHVWSVWHLMATEHSGWHVRHWTRTHGINFLCQYLLLTLTRLQLAVTLQYICRQLRTLGDNGINGSFKNSLFLIERQIKLAIINLGMVSAALTFRRKSLYPCIPVTFVWNPPNHVAAFWVLWLPIDANCIFPFWHRKCAFLLRWLHSS